MPIPNRRRFAPRLFIGFALLTLGGGALAWTVLASGVSSAEPQPVVVARAERPAPPPADPAPSPEPKPADRATLPPAPPAGPPAASRDDCGSVIEPPDARGAKHVFWICYANGGRREQRWWIQQTGILWTQLYPNGQRDRLAANVDTVLPPPPDMKPPSELRAVILSTGDGLQYLVPLPPARGKTPAMALQYRYRDPHADGAAAPAGWQWFAEMHVVR